MNLFKGILALIVGQALSWVQLYGQIKWPFFKNNIVFVILSGIPISILYYYSTTLLTNQVFHGTTWPVRLLGFSCGMVVFTACGLIVLGEGLNTKNSLCLLLSILIICIQMFWK